MSFVLYNFSIQSCSMRRMCTPYHRPIGHGHAACCESTGINMDSCLFRPLGRNRCTCFSYMWIFRPQHDTTISKSTSLIQQTTVVVNIFSGVFLYIKNKIDRNMKLSTGSVWWLQLATIATTVVIVVVVAQQQPCISPTKNFTVVLDLYASELGAAFMCV